uniref:Jacalin-type lectin domain-containing protein n=1 Tax=Amphimedon queenslandica TaxID=400682 RepID=A0A1X7VD75_AMPQE
MFKGREITLRSGRSYEFQENFDSLLESTANDFVEHLKAASVDPSELLNNLEKRYKQIKDNIANKNIPRTDVYTSGIASLPNGFNATVYAAIKSVILNDNDNINMRTLLFKMLESDHVFSEAHQTDLDFVTKFYSQINAQTYIISSGSLHNHPHWCVVNGIIIAACYQRKEVDPNYKCRLLLTSGCNIRGDKLQEFSNRINWMQAVSLQYFAPGTGSVAIDGNEVESTSVLPGTIEWNDTAVLDEQEFHDNYKNSAGARLLSKWRAENLGVVEIKPLGSQSQWLGLKPNASDGSVDFVLLGERKPMKVSYEKINFTDSPTDTVVLFKLQQLPKPYVTQSVFVKHKPGTLLTYYFYKKERENVLYLVANNNRITFSDNINGAALFEFINVSQESLNSDDIKNNKRVKLSKKLSNLINQTEATDSFSPQFYFQSSTESLPSLKFAQLLSNASENSLLSSLPSTMSGLLKEREQLLPHQSIPRHVSQGFEETLGLQLKLKSAQSQIVKEQSLKKFTDDLSKKAVLHDDVNEPFQRKESDRSNDSDVKRMSLKEFLLTAQHSENTILCQDLLGIIISHQFCSETLKDLPADSKMKEFLPLVFSFTVDESSTFLFENHYVIEAQIKLILSSEELRLNEHVITEVSFIANYPKTVDQTIDMQLETTSDGLSLTLVYHLKCDVLVQRFQKYLDSLGTKYKILKLYDAITTLLQSETRGYLFYSSLPQAIARVLQWTINEEESTVEFVPFPAGPIVVSADISVTIPKSNEPFDFGIVNLFQLSGLRCIIRPESNGSMYMLANGTVADAPVEVTFYSHDLNELPELEVHIQLPNTSLDHIASFFHFKNPAPFRIPLSHTTLKDIKITDVSFTCKQSFQQTKQLYLSKVVLGFDFLNLESYLPSSFEKLRKITSHVILYQPTITSSMKIGMESDFEFSINDDTSISAQLAAIPVSTDIDSFPSYDYTVSLQTTSNLIGSNKGGISIAKFLQLFGLSERFLKVASAPFLDNLLQNVELKNLVLSMNTSDKTVIKFFSLQLFAFNWEVIPRKIIILESQLSIDYTVQLWRADLYSNAMVGDQYPVTIKFDMSDANEASIQFVSLNYSFTISKFLGLFGFGSIDGLPIVEQLLNVAVTEAAFQITKKESQDVSIKNGSVSLYTESINIGSLFSISQVNATIFFVHHNESYVYRFAVSGFINDSLYISVEYNQDTSLLSGQLSIANFEEMNLSQVVDSLPLNKAFETNKNAVLNRIKQFPSVDIAIALKYVSKSFVLNKLMIAFDKTLTIGSLSFRDIKFLYENTPENITSVKLRGELMSKNINIVIEFDLTRDSSDKGLLTASILPSKEKPLTLRNFLLLFGVGSPSVPEIDGEDLSSLLDVALTNGKLQLAVDTFDIVEFEIEAETTRKVTIISSPLIKLQNVSLVINYKKSDKSKTTALVTGVFTLGNIDLTLQGIKEPDVVKFTLAAMPTSDINLQDSFTVLTPENKDSPKIPSDIGIPRQLKASTGQLIVQLSQGLSKEKSLWFMARSKFNWDVDLGFKKFVVFSLGGEVLYKTSVNQDPDYEVYIFGNFQLSQTTFLLSKLYFGSDTDTILNISFNNTTDLTFSSITDDLLGFNDQAKMKGTSFKSLLPDSTQAIELSHTDKSNFSMSINFSHKAFVLFGQLVSIGYAFLVAGNFSTGDISNYGYALGIALPAGFKPSDLLSSFSLIDDILTIRKASCIIISVKDVLVKDVVKKLRAVTNNVSDANVANLPFAGLDLDVFSNEQNLEPGLSIYCELDISEKGSLFSNLIKITDNSKEMPSIIVSAMIKKDPKGSVFRAQISELTLLGSFQFFNVLFEYSCARSSVFKLTGIVVIPLGNETIYFKGSFICSDAQSEYSAELDQKIDRPLGMSGVTIDNARLSMIYYTKEEIPSRQIIYGKVTFSSSNGDSSSPVILEGQLIFVNYSPVIVRINLIAQLSISDFISAVYNGHYNSQDYPDISFSNGIIYYAKSTQDIENFHYKAGYFVSADIHVDILNTTFRIEAHVSPQESKIDIAGYALNSLKLGFVELTGVYNGGPNENGPELHVLINKTSTNIFLDVGFILFEVPIGSTRIGYKFEGGKKKLFGDINFNGDISFFNGSTISYEYSTEDGFRVTKWEPIIGSLLDAFNFFQEIKKFTDGCGSFAKMAFKKGVQSHFNISFNLKKPEHPESDLADIEITGSYDVMLVNKFKIESVPLPPGIKATIKREDAITLHKLPQVILNALAEAAGKIIKKFMEDPDRLAKIMKLFVLEKLTEEMLTVLACRGLKPEQINPDAGEGGEDITKEDFNEATEAESNITNEIEGFENLSSASELASMIAIAKPLFYLAIGLFAGIVIAGGVIFIKWAIDYYNERSKVSEKRKRDLNDKLVEMDEKLTSLLDIGKDPKAHFDPPDQLTASWPSIKGANYHVTVTALLVSNNSNFGQGDSEPWKVLYDETISSNVRTYKVPNDVMKINIIVYATMEIKVDDKLESYNGKKYTVDVSEVHPTFYPPSDVAILFHHPSFKISITATPAVNEDQYFFELLDGRETSLSHFFYTLPPDLDKIHCNFPHHDIQKSSASPIEVCAKSVGKSVSGVFVAQSAFVYSNHLTLIDPIESLEITLPHFMDDDQEIQLKWSMAPSKLISKFLCKVVSTENKQILDEVPIKSDVSDTILVKKFTLERIVNALAGPITPGGFVQLNFMVSASSSSPNIIDSAFIGKVVSSLNSPEDVSFFFSSKESSLAISWQYAETSSYGLEIRDSETSGLVWRKKIFLQKDEIEENKVGAKVSIEELKNVNDPDKKYTVQVYSVASGNNELDSVHPGQSSAILKVLKAAVIKRFGYSFEKNSILLLLSELENVSNYLALFYQGKSLIKRATSSQPEIYVNPASIANSVNDLDTIYCLVRSLGSGTFISSPVTRSDNQLQVLKAPKAITYSYDPDTESITVSCLPSDTKKDTYRLGFLDATEHDTIFSKLATYSIGKSITAIFSSDHLRNSNTKEWKCFAQTTLKEDSNSEVPSRCLFLDNDINVLESPLIKDVRCSSNPSLTSLLLLVTATSVSEVNKYIIICDLFDANNSLLKELKDSTESESDGDVILTASISRKVRNWKEMQPQVASIKVTLIAGGSGFFISSKISEPVYIKKEKSLCDLAYSYDNMEDTVTITCKLVDSTKASTSKAILGLFDANNNDNYIFDIADYVEKKFSVILQGEAVRALDAIQCIVYAQTAGSSTNLPTVLTLQDHITVIQSPSINSVSYNFKSSSLAMSWFFVEHAISYAITIMYKISSGEIRSVTEESKDSNLSLLMNDKVSNWNEIIKHVTSITLNIVSIGNGYYINSNRTEFDMNRLPATANIYLHCTESDAIVSWDNVSLAKEYIITIDGGYQSLERIAPNSNTSITIPKRLLLLPSLKANITHTLAISVTAVPSDAHYLNSFPVMAGFEMKAQKFRKSPIYGTTTGTINDDGVECSGIPIVGIKDICIGFYKGSNVRYFRATYYLADGTTSMGLSHGFSYMTYVPSIDYDGPDLFNYNMPDNPFQPDAGNLCRSKFRHLPQPDIKETTISFDKEETIIAVRGSSDSTYACLYYLIFITQKPDGSYKKYGPFGSPKKQSSKDLIQIRFSGNVISFFGKCKAHESVGAIGFNYTCTSNKILVSNVFGGNNGKYFDDDTIIHIPPVTSIKEIRVMYSNECIIGIQTTSALSDGSEWTSSEHGGGKGLAEINKVSINLQNDEVIIGIIGKYSDNDELLELLSENNCHGLVHQLSFVTQQNDQTIKIHGPYGKDIGNTFTISGNLIGFYGCIGALNAIGGLGIYYSLECSELLGSSNENVEDFDDRALTHSPHIVGINNILIGFSEIAINFIMVTYLLSDGNTWQAPHHGSLGAEMMNSFQFENDEEIVEMKVSLHSVTVNDITASISKNNYERFQSVDYVTTLQHKMKQLSPSSSMPIKDMEIMQLYKPMLEITAKIPGVTAKIPGGTAKIPGGTAKIPEGTPKTPERTPKTSMGTRETPRGIPETRGGTPKTPGGTPEIPRIIPSDIPGVPPDIPGIIPKIPGVPPDIPGIIPKIPGVPPDIPGIIPKIPGIPPDIPGIIPKIPGVTPKPRGLPIPKIPKIIPPGNPVPKLLNLSSRSPTPETEPTPEPKIPQSQSMNVLGSIRIKTRSLNGSKKVYGPIGTQHDNEQEAVLNGRVIGLFGQTSAIDEAKVNIVTALGAYYIPL